MDEYRSALHLDNLGKFLTPINFAFGGLTILCGHWSIRLGFSLIEFAFFSGFFRLVLAAFFTYFLGLLLIAGDIPQFAFMQQHCKFLTMTLGRGVFNIFTGAWVYSLMATGTGFQAVLGWIDFVGLWTLGIFFIVLHFVKGRKYILHANDVEIKHSHDATQAAGIQTVTAQA